MQGYSNGPRWNWFGHHAMYVVLASSQPSSVTKATNEGSSQGSTNSDLTRS